MLGSKALTGAAEIGRPAPASADRRRSAQERVELNRFAVEEGSAAVAGAALGCCRFCACAAWAPWLYARRRPSPVSPGGKSMTPLRQRLVHDLQLRNYSKKTVECYV